MGGEGCIIIVGSLQGHNSNEDKIYYRQAVSGGQPKAEGNAWEARAKDE